jgi:hypothetical protein
MGPALEPFNDFSARPVSAWHLKHWSDSMDTVKDAVFRALRQVKYPGFSRDIVSFG